MFCRCKLKRKRRMKTNRHSSRFLELRALSSLEHLRFTTRQRMDGAYSGRHLSRQQGGSGEFVDFREYTSGDDLRRLDWKVLGRTGRRYLRLYQDETNLSCTLVLDASGSRTIPASLDVFRIADDGQGRQPATWSHGLGLGGIRKRVKLMGGTVEWAERAPRGIVCSVDIPHLDTPSSKA